MKTAAREIELETQHSLKKHRSIVHRTHLPTAFQEKIFNAFLLSAKVALKTNPAHPDRFYKEGFRTTERYIINFAALKSNNQNYIADSIDALQKNLIKFDFFHETKEIEVRQFSPVSEVRFLGNGELHFFLPPTIIDLMLDPNASYTINTKLTNTLTSVYAIAIYELGIIHKGESVEFGLQEFREFMGLQPTEYPTNNDLRRYVIERGCNEVNLKCDIEVKYQMVKKGQGNKVIGVKFTFSDATLPIDVEIPDEIQLELIATFLSALPASLSGDFKVITVLKKNLEEHGEAWVLSNVEAFLTRINTPGMPPVKNLGGLFRATFNNDYGKEIREAKAVVKAVQERKERKAAKERTTSKIDDSEESSVSSDLAYLQFFEKLPETKKKAILKEIGGDPHRVFFKQGDKEQSVFIGGPQELRITQYLKTVMDLKL